MHALQAYCAEHSPENDEVSHCAYDFAKRFVVVFAPIVAVIAVDGLISAVLFSPELGVLAGVLAMFAVDTALVLFPLF